jgi:SAM-dependent methyltransferase
MNASLGTDDRVFRFRAIPSHGVAVDDDPEPMVQQQLARLYFFKEIVGAAGCRLLDWGCGSGFNAPWLVRQAEASEVVGFDLSDAAIGLARATYPSFPFLIADACDPDLAIQPGSWDRILSCEVLEHVPDMPAFLANLRRHLADDGVAFVSTPNRMVFSLGHEPSPVNKEHIKELTLDEFAALLRPHFSEIAIYGQRFRDLALRTSWETDVRNKIQQCKAGTRWTLRESPRSRLRKWRAVEWAYQVPVFRSAWRALRWQLGGKLQRMLWPPRAPYRWSDFEFVSEHLEDSVWFCAVLRP